MPTKPPPHSQAERWTRLAVQFRKDFPHLGRWCDDTAEFSELRIKVRDDGTTLAIAKGYSSDGGPVVCFGVGYDLILSLMALDASIQGDNWRFDKPWAPKEE